MGAGVGDQARLHGEYSVSAEPCPQAADSELTGPERQDLLQSMLRDLL